MPDKFREKAAVAACTRLGDGIYDLKLQAEHIARQAHAGQFVSLYSADSSRLLPRPISICGADKEKGILRLVFRVAGKGTEEFSRLQAGQTVDLTGPLGKGFPLDRAAGKRVFLVGGGIGIPPLVELAKELADLPKDLSDREEGAPARIISVLGYRNQAVFLTEDLKQYGDLVLATEDGSVGTRGNVLDAIRDGDLTADLIYACGPTPMLRALQTYARETGTECWLSLEERMACGIGACLSCVCRSTEVDGHSLVKNKRICTEGPVFLSTDVEI